MLNAIWVAMVLGAIATAAWTGRMEAVSDATLESAKSAFDLVIGLTGGMVLFLGLVRVASEGGLLRSIAHALRPILRRMFPDVPEDHPAMSAMIMNLASNVMGLGNAATPFGVKAMTELDRLNPHPGSATNAMGLFLAINATSVVLFPPTGTVMVRLAAGSTAPFAIWVPTLIATFCSTTVAVITCLALARMRAFRPRPPAQLPPALTFGAADAPPPELPPAGEPASPLRRALLAAFALVVLGGLVYTLATRMPGTPLAVVLREDVSRFWLLPLLVAGLLAVGVAGRVRVYDAMVEGGREGLLVAVRIAPYLITIMVAIGMLRASGALDAIVGVLGHVTEPLGVPAEALPMVLLRPLSGSGAFAVMADILKTHGPDSFVGLLTSTLMGSTETTFYVLAVYLGAARVSDARHIVPACLAGDLAGFAGATVACHLFFGGVA